MSAPTIFRWDDPGAPDLATLLPTTSDVGKRWFHTVLKACLVTGYGSKSAAGWTMPEEELASNGTRFVLENGPKTGVLLYEQGFFSGGSSDMNSDTFWACSAVPSMDSPVNAFSYEREYSARNDSAAERFHKSSIAYFGQSARMKHWVCVANENTAILFSFPSTASTDRTSASGVSVDDCRLYIGCAHNSVNLGTVASPSSDNFFVAGLDVSSAVYTGKGNNSYWFKGYVSTVVGITGLSKVGKHRYTPSELPPMVTSSSLSAWLPSMLDSFHSGESSADGTTINDRYHLCSLVGFRSLGLVPINIEVANAWMVEQDFHYGQSVLMGDVPYLIYKGDAAKMFAINISADEWG